MNMNPVDHGGESISPQLEEFLQLIFEGSSDLIMILDENFRYEFMSRKESNGYTAEELMGINPFDLIHPDDRKTKELAKIVDDEEAKMEIRVSHKNGGWKWMEFRGHSFLTHEGKKKFFLIARNIHERKISEQKLIESEMRYRSLFENSEYAITIIDREGIFLLINKKGAEQLGGDPEDFIGKSIQEIFSKDDAEKNLYINSEVFRTGKPLGYTETFNLVGGKKTYIVKVQPIKDINDDITALQVSAFDITDILEIEQKLRESEEKFRYIVENSVEMVAILNDKLQYEYMNKALEDLSGYDKQDLNRLMPKDLIHPDDFSLAAETIRKGILDGSGYAKIRVKHKEGHYLWVEFRAKLFVNKKKESKAIMILKELPMPQE